MAEEYIVIGIPDSIASVKAQLLPLLKDYHVFSGGKRHHDLLQAYLPEQYKWIEIGGNMEAVFEQYDIINEPVAIVTSGDPLFYGFANTILKFRPEAKLKVHPYFNSLQLLCHATNTDYSHLNTVSVHGRSWQELDKALINGEKLIGVLTDKQKSPSAIAQRLLDYNFLNYRLVVGEALGGNNEKVTLLSLEEAIRLEFNPLNCVLLVQTKSSVKHFGIPDTTFEGLPNRPNMITKMPVRLLTLSLLNLINKTCFWDIGFCTGSVSIEARLAFPNLNITAFEIRPECSSIFETNAKKLSAPGIRKVMGDFMEIDLSQYLRPDAVFIGGHGNRLNELMNKVDEYLLPGATIAINAVLPDSKDVFIKSADELGYKLKESYELKVDQHNPITLLVAEKPKAGFVNSIIGNKEENSIQK